MPPLTSGFEWDENAIQNLRSMWDEGLSTAEIGRRLGVTKNAIVGKAHRLALPCRPSPIRSCTFSKPRKPKRPRCPTLTELERPATGSPPPAPSPSTLVGVRRLHLPPPERPAPPPVRPVQTAILGPHPCCWPFGEPGTASFHFCGEPNQAGKPYCPKHCAGAYQQPRERRAA